MKFDRKIATALFSGFTLTALTTLVGLFKMGLIAHSVSTELLSEYFIYLAIWVWIATNGESVRQEE